MKTKDENPTTVVIIPSFFAIITTVVGFSSLVLSNIEPVINLGLMMSVGILVSLDRKSVV